MSVKDLNVTVLLDFYGQMLTQKQFDVIDLYYNEDLSLSEIAEHQGITRQGVRDSIKRGELYLFELEEKLNLFSTYIETKKSMKMIKYLAEEISEEIGNFNYSNKIKTNINSITELADRFAIDEYTS